MAPAISLRNVEFGQSADGPLVEAGRLLSRVTARDDKNSNKDNSDPSKGVLDPHDINNAGFFFLFALIGVAFVLTGIWFFFWAKNGGFHFKEDDWDDYKSTVLRRKGPNGTVLSNATRSTKLGGGSVYKQYDDFEDDEDGRDGTQTVITESTGLSGITAGPSDIYAREKREEKRKKREAERRKKKKDKDKDKDNAGGNEGVVDEQAEKEAREQLRNYRTERAARVGGLNKEAEGSEWEGSTTNAGGSTVSSSGLQSGESSRVSAAPPAAASSSRKAAAGGGIRKVYSVADRTTAREKERMRAEAKKMREEGRMVRRDYSFQRASQSGASQAGESLLGGSSVVKTESDVGTKSYHHPLPELREHRKREREERRARRGGYRRGNTRDEDEEVD